MIYSKYLAPPGCFYKNIEDWKIDSKMLPSIGSHSRQIHDLLKVSAFIYHEKP